MPPILANVGINGVQNCLPVRPIPCDAHGLSAIAGVFQVEFKDSEKAEHSLSLGVSTEIAALALDTDFATCDVLVPEVHYFFLFQRPAKPHAT